MFVYRPRSSEEPQFSGLAFWSRIEASHVRVAGSPQSEEPSEATQSSIPIRRAVSAELTDCTQFSSLKCRLTSPVTVTLDAATLDALQSRHSRTATEAPLTKTGTRGGVKTARTQKSLHTCSTPTKRLLLLALVTEAAPELWQKLGKAGACSRGSLAPGASSELKLSCPATHWGTETKPLVEYAQCINLDHSRCG